MFGGSYLFIMHLEGPDTLAHMVTFSSLINYGPGVWCKPAVHIPFSMGFQTVYLAAVLVIQEMLDILNP